MGVLFTFSRGKAEGWAVDYKIVTVHGTFVDSSSLRGDEWWQDGSPFQKGVMKYLGDETHTVVWAPFPWSGANSLSERYASAEKLRRQMTSERRPPERVVHLCHSHGGNVFEYAARRTTHGQSGQTRAITVGTPFLLEQKIQQFGWVPLVGPVLIYTALALFLALGFLELGPDLERILLIAAGICLAVSPIALLFGGYTRFMANALWVRPPGWLGYAGLGLAINWLIRSLKKDANRSYPRDARRNRASIKIFSKLDEAIAVLPTVNEQEIELATRATLTGVSTALWTVTLLLGAAVALPLWGLSPFELPVLDRFTLLPPGALGLEAAWVDLANRAADLALVALAAGVLGGALAATPITEWIVGLFNRTVTRIARDTALGKDSSIAISLAGRISDNLPLLYGRFEADDAWKAMPNGFDTRLEELIKEETVETAKSIRKTLALGMLSGGFSTLDAVKKNISGKELVHTSYFRHEKFAAFIAYLLVHEHGFPPSKHFEEIAEDATLRAWYDEIRVADEPSPAARGEAKARSDQTAPAATH
ncbi:MAG: hypothetical protein AAFY97_02790 [Pseudomonadota bacterium]